MVKELKEQKNKQFKNVFESKKVLEELVEFGFPKEICEQYLEENTNVPLDIMINEISKLIEQNEEDKTKQKQKEQNREERKKQGANVGNVNQKTGNKAQGQPAQAPKLGDIMKDSLQGAGKGKKDKKIKDGDDEEEKDDTKEEKGKKEKAPKDDKKKKVEEEDEFMKKKKLIMKAKGEKLSDDEKEEKKEEGNVAKIKIEETGMKIGGGDGVIPSEEFIKIDKKDDDKEKKGDNQKNLMKMMKKNQHQTIKT